MKLDAGSHDGITRRGFLGAGATFAAAPALAAGVSPKDADVSAIRKSLLSQGAILQPSA